MECLLWVGSHLGAGEDHEEEGAAQRKHCGHNPHFPSPWAIQGEDPKKIQRNPKWTWIWEEGKEGEGEGDFIFHYSNLLQVIVHKLNYSPPSKAYFAQDNDW